MATTLNKTVDRLAIAAAKDDKGAIRACVSDLYDMLKRMDTAMKAVVELQKFNAEFAFAVQEDLPLPLSAYRRWGSYHTLRRLAMGGAQTGAVDWSTVGGFTKGKKIYIRPSDFSKAIKRQLTNN